METPVTSLPNDASLHRRFSHPIFAASATHKLLLVSLLSLPLYAAVLIHGDFRPRRIEPFFPIFFGLFALYVVACVIVLGNQRLKQPSLWVIGLFALVFNVMLIPSPPTLSDDMYRYIWDGRVQGNGFNPYQYSSSAGTLRDLRDNDIWRRMNRHDAVTIYPPGAQLVFALSWRLFGDSVYGMKLVMIGATLLAGILLVFLLRALGQPPQRVLIFLWNPLLIFEVAHSAHVDALYLPAIVAACLLRVLAPSDRVDWRYEAGIGALLGVAILFKLLPAMLVPCLWFIRGSTGKRHWRLALPVACGVTVALGYALYLQPNVNLLGFLPTYGREIFNISPLMRLLTGIAMDLNIGWWLPANVGMPLLVALASFIFLVFPSRSPREAVLRCFVPITFYVLINHNLFSWYVLWLLPFITLSLELRPLRVNLALAWWVFTGLVALSYTFFLTWQEEPLAIQLQFLPLYVLLAVAVWHRAHEFRRWFGRHNTAIGVKG